MKTYEVKVSSEWYVKVRAESITKAKGLAIYIAENTDSSWEVDVIGETDDKDAFVATDFGFGVVGFEKEEVE